MEASERLEDEILSRRHADNSINQIGELLFGEAKSSRVLNRIRGHGQSFVDDWNCFKKYVSQFSSPMLSYTYFMPSKTLLMVSLKHRLKSMRNIAKECQDMG